MAWLPACLPDTCLRRYFHPVCNVHCMWCKQDHCASIVVECIVTLVAAECLCRQTRHDSSQTQQVSHCAVGHAR